MRAVWDRLPCGALQMTGIAVRALPALLLAGCFGTAHVAVEMPPLVVQGVVLTPEGKPLPDRELVIARADFHALEETFDALTSGDLGHDADGYAFCTVRTSSSGGFSCLIRGESRRVGSMPRLTWPGRSTLDAFVVGIRMPSGFTFAVDVSRRHATILVPTGPEFKLIRPPALPVGVSAAVNRYEESDVLQLIVRTGGPAS